MKWHVEIVATENGRQFIQHYFVNGADQQEAARAARWRFVTDYYEGNRAEFVRVQLVEEDTGVLIL